MLLLFNAVLTYAPEFNDGPMRDIAPAPILMRMNYCMSTSAGLRVFTNPKVNTQLKKILTVWANFLASAESRYVLTNEPNGWFGPSARKVFYNFEKTYDCDPTKEHWGFSSWDDFFTRRLRPGVRPTDHPEDGAIIVNPCESVVYKISEDVQARSHFWLKGQPYSLYHMLNNDNFSYQFVGGTVYQGFLSALNYHRWHSPVNGTIAKIAHVPGAYCAASPAVGFGNGRDAGSNASVASQAFLTNLATRVLIFIQADNPDIGLMCFVGVGMVEVSSCEATVVEGQRVKKGDQIGMFHYGGSTHCLVFRPGTKIVFSDAVLRSLKDGKSTVLINSSVGRLSVK